MYDEPQVQVSEFIEHGDTYHVESVDLDDGSTVVTVKISRDGEHVSEDRFSGYEAMYEANSFIAARIEATDPDRPSLEERLAPFGEEWEREQMERMEEGGVPF